MNAEPEKAPILPLDSFRMDEKVNYLRLSEVDKKLVGRYFRKSEWGRDLIAKVKLLHEAFGGEGIGAMEMPPDFWPYMDQLRGMKPAPYRRPKIQREEEDPVTHQVMAPQKPVVLGLELYQASSNIEYDRLSNEDKAILGRWLKGCEEGLDIMGRVDERLRRDPHAGAGFIKVPFVFWDWLYEERKRIHKAQQAAAPAKAAA